MQKKLISLVNSNLFNAFIMGVILLAGGLVGLETSPGMIKDYGSTLKNLDKIIIGIFVIEIFLKMAAHGRRPWHYFKEPWNIFDFTIVSICFIPAFGQYAVVLRMARLFRVLRLIRFIPELRILVSALFKSVPSMGYVSILLGILFYMYGVAGVFLFRENDPVHFGNLQTAMLSLFRVVTLEDWTDIMYTQLYGCAVYGFGTMEDQCTQPQTFPLIAPFYFISFVLIGTMVVLNLFIGIIMSGMDEATAEEKRALVLKKLQGPNGLDQELNRLDQRMAAVQEQLERVTLLAIQMRDSQNPPFQKEKMIHKVIEKVTSDRPTQNL
jgi:voltage-gated sodium channel